MNKRILSVIVFGAALLSAQAQDGKGGISPAMLGQIQQSYQGTPSDKALRNAIGNNDIRKLGKDEQNARLPESSRKRIHQRRLMLQARFIKIMEGSRK